MEESIMVLEESRPYLQSLTKLSKQLNGLTDRYTEELKTLEAELQTIGLGIEVELLYERVKTSESYEEYDDTTETAERYQFAWLLSYGRIKSGWGLRIRRYRLVGAEDVSPSSSQGLKWVLLDEIPLLESSRDLRIEAARCVPLLLEEIERKVKEKIDLLQEVSDRREINLEEVAQELGLAKIPCVSCAGNKIQTRGNANSPTGKVTDTCTHCLGAGYLWDTLPLDPNLPRPLGTARSNEQLLSLARQKKILKNE